MAVSDNEPTAHMVEAAVISQKSMRPLRWSIRAREDMTNGIYRPTYTATYKAGLDENNNVIAFHVKVEAFPNIVFTRIVFRRAPLTII